MSDVATFTLFADDTVLTVHNKDLKQAGIIIQSVLSKITVWCRKNKLTLNASKTEYVIYGTKARKGKAPQINLEIGGIDLKEVDLQISRNNA